MRILVNYDQQFEGYKGTIAGLLKQKGLTGIATGKTFEIGTLLETAAAAKCQGILIANEETLRNCVNSSKKVSLDKYRGSRLNFSIPAIVGAPLQHLRIVRHGRWLYERDLDKFKHIHTPVLRLDFKVCNTRNSLDAALAKSRESLIISTDIETDLYNRITCVGYSLLNSNLTTSTFLIPLINFGQDAWEHDVDYEYALEIIKKISALSQPKLYFNGIYDSLHQIIYHAEPNNFTLDAMALAHAEFAELPKSLDFVASVHLYDYYFWKDEADDARKHGDIQAYWAYCARDAWNTLRVFCSQLKTAKTYALKNYQMLFKIVYPNLYCAFEGIALDQEILKENKTKAQTIVEKARANLQVMAASPNFNPASPKQVGELLYDILGATSVNKKRKNKDGTVVIGRSTDEKSLLKISSQHPLLEVVTSSILEFREKAKAISTYFNFPQWKGWDYVNSEPCTNGGRLLFSINPFGTDTGRSSSNASSLRLFNPDAEKPDDRIKNYGTQIQNIPIYAKNMLIADEGYELGEADNNKSEARCVGFSSGCPNLIKALSDPEKDFYRVLGTIFFGLEYKDVSSELRNKVLKRIVHGRNYLMGADTFIEHTGAKQLYDGAKLLNYPIKSLKAFATYLLSLYNKPFPEINQWYNEIKLEVVRNHTLTSPLGYTRYFFGDIIRDHKVFRNAVAHGPQNLSVTIIYKGLWKVYKELVLKEHGDFRLKAHIHDSIFWQSVVEKREEYKIKVQELMKNPVTIKGRTMIIPVDINFGRSWLDLKS